MNSATGTSNNDAYQAIRTQINDISQKMNAIYEAMGDSSLSDEQKEAKQKRKVPGWKKNMIKVSLN